MRVWLVLASLAVAAAAQGDAAADPETALARRLIAAEAELAEAAFGLGLFREAATSAAIVLRSVPDHDVARVTQRLKQVPADEFVKRYREASKRHAREFRERAKERRRPLAEELLALADVAVAAKDDARAERLLVRAYEVDPDDNKALAALRKRDFDVIFNYGVVPRAEKASARALLRELGGGFLQRSDLDDELEHWVDAWGLQTRHYRFVTNAPHALVFAFARACEDLHDALDAFMVDAKQPLRQLGKPCTIQLFATKADYECLLRLQSVEPIDSDQALGFYDPTTKVGYFFHDAAFYGGDATLLFETFFHEGAHQMFDLRWRAPYRGRADGAPLEWVEEGFAVYLESLVMEGEGSRRRARFGTLVDDDLASALAAAAAHELMPMEQFAHLTRDGWDAYEVGYPHAALVVHWLLMADGGKRRAKAFELLLAERQTGGLRKGTMFDLLGMKPAEIDAALVAHAGTIGRTLVHRAYK